MQQTRLHAAAGLALRSSGRILTPRGFAVRRLWIWLVGVALCGLRVVVGWMPAPATPAPHSPAGTGREVEHHDAIALLDEMIAQAPTPAEFVEASRMKA